ncbi:MAG: MYXO-CTERM sorting domain-containing protein [bacterium]|nr:MYXO-CTERM sorting domain-containing protein [bacterium]
MKRLALFGSWKRLGVQAGLLAGLGLAFVGGSEKPAQAGADCVGDEACSFKKPNLLIVLDYSSSMNDDFQPGQTRWEAAVEAIDNIVTTDNGFFDESMHLGLLRFGHDPDPDNEGTIITVSGQTDPSGITDGQALDVPWYDADNDPSGYFECTGEDISTFLNSVEPPLCVGLNCAGIGTWTQGALLAARDYIAQTRADHPDDLTPGDERAYFVMLMTDGVWTTQTGQAPANATEQAAFDPVPVGGDLFATDDVPVYVVAFGDALGEGFADDLANAGGTVQAIDAGAGQLVPALETVIEDIEDTIIIPECTGGLPRIMVVRDASSSMLNTGNPLDPDNYVAGAMGMTGWDQARDALSGDSSLFDVLVPGVNNQPVEDLVHLGLITFGTEGDQQLLVDYGPCMKDNFGWALDPNTTCGPGCADPWGGPPIIWSPVGPGDAAYPGFDQDTYSTMPDCNTGMFDLDACTGSATATHTGLALANANAEAYRMSPPELYPVDGSTQFFNIIITDGAYSLNGWSTDEQVSAELTDMYTNDNTTTFVIGFGDDEQLAPVELGNMACWGSGGTGIPCNGGAIDYFTAANQTELEDALQTIIEQITFDPCCGFNDCSFNPEPTTGEPDPIPEETSTGPGETTGDDSTGPSLTSGSGDSSSGEPPAGSSSSGEPAADSSSSAGDDSTTDDPDPTNDPTNVTGNDESGGDESSGGDSAGAIDDDGCGCSAGNDEGSGWLGGMFMLGLFGLVRRRK